MGILIRIEPSESGSLVHGHLGVTDAYVAGRVAITVDPKFSSKHSRITGTPVLEVGLRGSVETVEAPGPALLNLTKINKLRRAFGSVEKVLIDVKVVFREALSIGLLPDPATNTARLSPGMYHVPFSFKLPCVIPPSFEGGSGRVSYVVSATLRFKETSFSRHFPSSYVKAVRQPVYISRYNPEHIIGVVDEEFISTAYTPEPSELLPPVKITDTSRSESSATLVNPSDELPNSTSTQQVNTILDSNLLSAAWNSRTNSPPGALLIDPSVEAQHSSQPPPPPPPPTHHPQSLRHRESRASLLAARQRLHSPIPLTPTTTISSTVSNESTLTANYASKDYTSPFTFSNLDTEEALRYHITLPKRTFGPQDPINVHVHIASVPEAHTIHSVEASVHAQISVRTGKGPIETQSLLVWKGVEVAQSAAHFWNRIVVIRGPIGGVSESDSNNGVGGVDEVAGQMVGLGLDGVHAVDEGVAIHEGFEAVVAAAAGNRPEGGAAPPSFDEIQVTRHGLDLPPDTAAGETDGLGSGGVNRIVDVRRDQQNQQVHESDSGIALSANCVFQPWQGLHRHERKQTPLQMLQQRVHAWRHASQESLPTRTFSSPFISVRHILRVHIVWHRPRHLSNPLCAKTNDAASIRSSTRSVVSALSVGALSQLSKQVGLSQAVSLDVPVVLHSADERDRVFLQGYLYGPVF
ncbi:hypothetical protein CcCBS67573_g05014 [Chytriomyces confervae]|uniref:Arrestin-like N-terminal domain-containing protein n=1 Tax=Chytriomyces confervae TaxID=246404 RepID=A0A507FEJ8_9FUNG|nr:hypothetical protein HDU80_008329 [Chytriomyces hyalinus]TPX73716.1 hypothetical protein CcCBS67573_g05014 [Chytriomyces confervae]